jgi:hypothetical protein
VQINHDINNAESKNLLIRLVSSFLPLDFKAKYDKGKFKRVIATFDSPQTNEILPATLEGLLTNHQYKESILHDSNRYFIVTATLSSKSINIWTTGDNKVNKEIEALVRQDQLYNAEIKVNLSKDSLGRTIMTYNRNRPIVFAIKLYELITPKKKFQKKIRYAYCFVPSNYFPEFVYVDAMSVTLGEVLDKPVVPLEVGWDDFVKIL